MTSEEVNFAVLDRGYPGDADAYGSDGLLVAQTQLLAGLGERRRDRPRRLLVAALSLPRQRKLTFCASVGWLE